MYSKLISILLIVSCTVIVLSHIFNIQGLSRERLTLPESEMVIGTTLFGCMINGKLWIEQENLQVDLQHDGNLFYLNLWLGDDFQNRIAFVLNADEIGEGYYALNNPSERYALLQYYDKDCLYATDSFYEGGLIINSYDEERKLISGSFEFLAHAENCQEVLRVTNGRFNLNYR